MLQELVSSAGKHSPENKVDHPVFDIIIVQNLHQCSKEDDKRKWWLDMVPLNDITCTVLGYSYDFPCDSHNPSLTKWDNLISHEIDLLEALKQRRLDTKLSRRKLIFICHTFGSIIVKKAIHTAQPNPLYSEIYHAIAGLVFIGNINNTNEENRDRFIDCFMGAISVELSLPLSSPIIRFLKSTEQIKKILKICEDFQEWHPPCVIQIFSEGKPTKMRLENFVKRKPIRLVPDDLAKFDAGKRGGTKTIVQLELDHEEIIAPTIPGGESLLKLQAAFTSFISKDAPLEVVLPVLSKRTMEKYNPKIKPCQVIRPYQKNLSFSGRGSLLEEMRRSLSPQYNNAVPIENQSRGFAPPPEQRSFALYGLGGMGKTQTALAYTFESLELFPFIFWAHAETKAKLAQSFVEFAFELGLVESITANQATCRQKLKVWFEKAETPWLLVFDNVEEETGRDYLNDIWPLGNYGSILVTTRDKSILGRFPRIRREITPMAKDDAVDLLLSLTDNANHNDGEEKDYAAKVCETLGSFPLAIDAAAWTIYEKSLTIKEYLELYTNHDLITTSERVEDPATRYKHSLLTVWEPHFKELDSNSRFLVEIMSFLDADAIQEDLFLEGAAITQLPKLKLLNKKRFILALARCRGLITRNADLKQVWIHRLVQDDCQRRMNAPARQSAFDAAFEIIHNSWPVTERHNRQRPDLWESKQKYLPHIVSLTQRYEASFEENQEDSTSALPEVDASPKFPELLHNGAWYLYERGDLESPLYLLQCIEDYCKKSVKDSELNLVDVYYTYAAIASESNRMSLALSNFKKSAEYLSIAFQKDLIKRPDIREALAFGGLANGHAGMHEYGVAETYYRKCIEVWKRTPGEPDIYITHLANCLNVQGKTDEAERVIRELIDSREKRFGKEDTNSYRTGIAYRSLGNIQVKQGKFEEASKTHDITLRLMIATGGERHRRTADAYYKVGWHAARRGDFKVAREKLEHTLDVFLGNSVFKNEAARIYFKLAEVYRGLKMEKESKEALQNADRLRKEIMGDNYKRATSELDYDEMLMIWSR